MIKSSKLTIGVTVIALAAVSAISTTVKAQSAFTTDRIFGDPDAPTKITEYASLGCIHCKNFHENVWPEFKTTYIDTGKVQYTFRVFPFHLQDLRAVTLARCAGESRYDAFIDLLFKRRDDWLKEEGFLEELNKLALQGGVSIAEYEACQVDEALQQSILDRRNAGVEAGIQSTPSFVLNDDEVITRISTMADWVKILGDGSEADQTSSATTDNTIAYTIGGAVVATMVVGGIAYARRHSIRR